MLLNILVLFYMYSWTELWIVPRLNCIFTVEFQGFGFMLRHKNAEHIGADQWESERQFDIVMFCGTHFYMVLFS